MVPMPAPSEALRQTGPQRVWPSTQLPEVIKAPKSAVPQQHVQVAVKRAAGEVHDVHGAPPQQWRARSFASDTYRRSSNKKQVRYAIYYIPFSLSTNPMCNTIIYPYKHPVSCLRILTDFIQNHSFPCIFVGHRRQAAVVVGLQYSSGCSSHQAVSSPNFGMKGH